MQAGDHATEGVSSQGLPEQTGQLRVTVRDVDTRGVFLARGYLVQSAYHLSQSEQTLVDFNGFFLCLSSHISVALSLRSSEIYELKLAEYHIIRILRFNLFHCECKYGVRSGRTRVHLMRPDYLVFEPEMKQIHDLLILGALVREQILHSVDIVRVPLQFETLRVALRPPEVRLIILLPEHGAIQQVIDALVVELHKRDIYRDLSQGRFRTDPRDFLEKHPRASLNEAQVVICEAREVDALVVREVLVALHGEGLA